jgi:type II secretory pathway component PulJ
VKAESGTSLLELLVAQALGLLLMAGLLKSLADGLDQQRQLEDRLQLRESAQLVSVVLQHSLAASGFVDWSDRAWGHSEAAAPWAASRVLPGGAALFACPGDMQGSALQHASASAAHSPRCGSLRPLRQTLQLVRQGATTPTPQWPGHSSLNAQDGKDCLQQTSPGPWVVNRLYTRMGNLGSQLLCAGSGNQTGQALVAGVEEWVFRFLVRQPNGHTQWLETVDMGPADAANWQRVVRLEVCWVLTSSETGRGGSHAHRTQNLRPTCQRSPDGQWQPGVARSPSDRRLWQRHTHTMALLNTRIPTE